jgi:hypothetical protein
MGTLKKQHIQGKKWQCQRYMVIACSVKYSNPSGNTAKGVAL